MFASLAVILPVSRSSRGIQVVKASRGSPSCCSTKSGSQTRFRFGDDSKTTIEQASGVWCAEVAELEGMSDRREKSAIKAAITRTTDKARLAYGRSATIVPRQFVMIATTNEPAYLKDRGGNRRFWPMRVDPGVLDKSEKTLLKNLDQLWAEAAVAEAAGEEHTSVTRVMGGRHESPKPACCR